MVEKLKDFILLKIYGFLSSQRKQHFQRVNSKYLFTDKNVYFGEFVSINPFNWMEGKLRICLAENVKIHDYCLIQGSGDFTVGKNSFIGRFSIIGVNSSITIGSSVMIAQSVSIRDTDHRFDDINENMLEQGISTSPIVIEDNVWIGHGAVITKGVTIGSGSIIGANAVVTKSVARNSIMGGVPAKIIRVRN